MSFSIVAIAASILMLLLAIGWLFAGGLVLKRWGIEANTLGLLVGRRLGAAYLGISLLMFLGRSAPPSELRSAVCIAMFVAVTLVALLGLFELKAHRVGKGILVSVVVEAILAAGFAWVLLA